MAGRTTKAIIAVLAASTALGGPAWGQGAKVSRPSAYEGFAQAMYDGHERTSFYIPMRDGTRLAADLFRPTKGGKVASEKLPVVWMHTPYNRRTYRGGSTAERYPGYALQLVKYGYNVAVVDFRGLYASFGRNMGYNRGEWAPAARMDAYDVTEWFAKQPYSSGRIGMWGCSATGGSQMQAATTRPPSLKAIVPMSAEFDAYPFVAFGGVSVTPRSDGNAPAANAARDAQAAPVDGAQGPALLRQAIAEHAQNVETFGQLPFRDSRSAVNGDDWLRTSSPSTYLDKLKAPGLGVLAVANWDEASTRHGAFLTFNNVPNAKLLAGPSTHCNWSDVKEKTGFDLVTEELRFYDHWLKGVDNGVMDEPKVTYFTYNAPAGQAWRQSATWPLKTEKRTDYFLGAGSLDPSSGPAGADKGPVAAAKPATSTVIEAAEGGLKYETAPLSRDLEVTGHPVVTLYARAAGDFDVLARLEDVAPDGKATSYQMVGRLRASHRKLGTPPYNHLGLPWPTHVSMDALPVTAGKAEQLTFDMLPMSYVFKAGHRVRLVLTFSPADGQGPQTVEILRGGPQASKVVLPVIPADAPRQVVAVKAP